MDVVVEPAAPDSAEGRMVLGAFFRDVMSRHFGREATRGEVDATMKAEPSADLRPPGGLFFVARRDGAIIGCAGLRLVAAGTGEVTRMFVLPEARRRGAGQLLLEAVEAAAREQKVIRLRLGTSRHLTEAGQLYTRNGYREVPAFSEGPLADQWYEKSLSPRVAGVLLAAGEGSRFGRPKALVTLDGRTLAERGVDLLRAGGADPVIVVTGAARIDLDNVHTVYNNEWRAGMGSSLRAALQALDQDALDQDAPADVGAVVVALADQPLVGAEAVARLIAAYRAGASVAVATYQGRPRNPVLLAREHWPEISAMATGDQGARAFLRARPDLVTLVECGDTGRPDDIDTPADLDRIAARRRE